jgi:hypothetical protein
MGGRVAHIDSEHGSASKYADLFDFDTLKLESFAPERYIEAIEAAKGYSVLNIDSLSHAWAGKDGLLEFVDKEAARSKSGNSYVAWRHATPKHNRLVEAILGAEQHVIVTLRSKMEYVQEKDEKTGKVTVRKIGLQPIQREGLEYEFDVVGDLDQRNQLVITKSRCPSLTDAVLEKPGKDLADTLRTWLTGAPRQPKPTKANGGDYLTDLHRERLKEAAETGGVPTPKVTEIIREAFGVDNSRQVLAADFDKLLALIEAQGQEAR